MVLRDNPMEYTSNYVERVQVRAPTSLQWLDGEPIEVAHASAALVIKLAFQQHDGDQF